MKVGTAKLSVDSTKSMFIRAVFMGVLIALFGACRSSEQPVVVVYTAHDELYSKPIFERFEEETGIEVRAQYDTEASKTSGLVNRLIAEKDRPRADVFWNNEVVQTIVLKNEGVLAPYKSPAAEPIPERYKDAEGYWTGFAARARVIIYNTDLVDDPSRSILDFAEERWRGKAAIANPLFGTTATHAAALFALWGEDKAREFFNVLKANDVAILPGNATVRDLVARGEYHVGLTDTDDANGGVEDGFPVAWHLPDQGEGELGTLIIPNTVAMIAGGPNPETAKQLIDYLLSPAVEEPLAKSRSIQIPLNPNAEGGPKTLDLDEVTSMDVDFEAAAQAMAVSAPFIRDEFLP